MTKQYITEKSYTELKDIEICYKIIFMSEINLDY